MKLHSRFKPELCAADAESGRELVYDPNLDVSRKALIATDGHCLVSVPVELDDGDASGIIPRKALDMARGEAKEIREPSLTAFDEDGNGPEIIPGKVTGHEPAHILARDACALDSGVTVPRPTRDFPEYMRVVPERRRLTGRLCLSAELLLKLAEALGANRGQVIIDFDPNDATCPLLVRARDEEWPEAFGVLMPVSQPDKRKRVLADRATP